MTNKLGYFACSLLLVLLAHTSKAQATDVVEIPTGKHGMVSTQESIASRVGLEILKQGGNAIDSAVAIGFALAVTYPRAGNLGGGGFMMIYLGKEQRATAIDYREVAPEGSRRDMFLDEKGNVDTTMSLRSALSSGVPGTVAGMIYALEKYGTMSLTQVIQPAIDLAINGFEVSKEFHRSLGVKQKLIGKNPATAEIFYPNGNAPEPGTVFKQPDLGRVLTYIRDKGRDGFYKGEIARKIVADSLENDGILTKQDLANYHIVERQPLVGSYRGYEIQTMPPPSSGGIHLIQMLNILEHWDIRASGLNTATTINRVVESMKRAYADRSEHLADPAFYQVPVEELTSKDYARSLYEHIEQRQVTPSKDIAPVKLAPHESEQTTHYSVMDQFGNAVSNTYTLNDSYGNGRVVKGTGILMNNEMDDFSAKPGVPNLYGLIGGDANAIQPGKRPLSSMTPTILVKNQRPIFVTGSMGGSKIITSVLLGVSNFVDHQLDLHTLTKARRFHHQWYPDVLEMESGFEIDTLNQLTAMGYKVNAPELTDSEAEQNIGYLQSITYQDGVFKGMADPRRPGSLAVGF